MFTLIIPTAGRPRMLRHALESVARQTALHKIRKVYVSENGGSRESEKVCAEFPTLPIVYKYRVPTTPFQHGRILLRECLHDGLTAFLHDDDWWMPLHVANAVAALEEHPDAGAYGASHFVVAGESSMLNCLGNLFPWFGSNYACFKPVWELSRLNVLMASLLGTMSHYSTLVARTEVLRKAASIFDQEIPYDNDRRLLVALTVTHPFLFNPIPEAFIRNHESQDCGTYDSKAQVEHMSAGTRWMVEKSGKSWEVIADQFARRLALCPPHAKKRLTGLASEPWCLPEITRNAGMPWLADTARPRSLAAVG